VKKIITVFLVLLFALSFNLQVFAQDTATASTQETKIVVDEDKLVATQSGVKIFNKERTSQRIPELKTLYRDQIEAYRKSQKEFVVAKTNYGTVETLTSLEEAVTATRVVMEDRSKVMITYLEFLVATLEDTSGVELSLKQDGLKQLNSMVVALKIHQEDIALAKDRVAVNNLADNFVPYAQQYSFVVYKAMSLIKIGQIQSVYDVATLIKEDVVQTQEDQEVGAVVKAKRDRAYQEIERNFVKINSSLSELNVRINGVKPESFTQSFYEKILVDLESTYTQLSKSLDYLAELLKL